MSKKKKIPKPRNPFVQHLVVKKQGAHTESKKGKRSKEKAALKKERHYDKAAWVRFFVLMFQDGWLNSDKGTIVKCE